MKFSVVTISFNQAEFLERTIQSVISQKGIEFEYIMVDPGSTDGSRDIIDRYRNHFSHIILEKDEGAADGLNRGFALATGDVYCYLNSDDTFEPDAFKRVAAFFEAHDEVDVLCGHAYVIDRHDRRLRRVWSEPYYRLVVAYGAAVQIQPSTFIRKEAFRRTSGFNVNNRSNWDGELLSELFLNDARISIFHQFLSCYRLHEVSITSSGSLDKITRIYHERLFERLVGRPRKPSDKIIGLGCRILKHLRDPEAFVERLKRGPIYLRKVS